MSRNHIPVAVVENSNVKVLWDFNIYTDHFVTACRPDIVVVNKHQKLVQIIDVAVPSDCNVSMKENEKIEKYIRICLLNCHLYGK